jgi:Zn-dependent M28 family amino/carboxypeptidase
MADADSSDGSVERRLRTHVDRLAGLIGPRHFGVPGALVAAAALIEREFVEMGYSVTRQAYPVDGHEAVNLIAQLDGRDRADEIVVLGAHYDTVETTPGADDNASAVAVLIEAARLLRQSSPRRTIRFVAFACEEPPHFYTATMGSQVYARRCRVGGERITSMLCLEMVGYYSDVPGSQGYPAGLPRWIRWALPRRGNFLAAVSNLRSWKLCWGFRRGFKRAIRFPLYSIALPEAANIIRLSDNSSFWDQGYPAIMITDTSFLRNPHYHLPTDLPNTLDYRRMSQVTCGVAGAVSRLSRGKFAKPG